MEIDARIVRLHLAQTFVISRESQDVADVVHVAAMGLWLGGLVILAAAVPVAARGLGPPERRWVVGRTAS